MKNNENYFPSFMSIDMTGISMKNMRSRLRMYNCGSFCERWEIIRIIMSNSYIYHILFRQVHSDGREKTKKKMKQMRDEVFRPSATDRRPQKFRIGSVPPFTIPTMIFKYELFPLFRCGCCCSCCCCIDDTCNDIFDSEKSIRLLFWYTLNGY